MTLFKCRWTSVVLILLFGSRTIRADQHYVSVFSDLQLQSKITWPLPFSNRWDLLDTFGPRFAGWPTVSVGLKDYDVGALGNIHSEIRYDFHAGINIRGKQGDPVVAVHRAKVHSVSKVHALSTVVLKHWFNQDVFLRHSEKSTRVWYTVYGNLAGSNVTEGQMVEGGDDVGVIGTAKQGSYGNAAYLHQELWIGTLFATATVHPMVMFDQLEPWNTFQLRVKPAVSMIQEPTPLQDGIFSISVSNSLLHIDRYTFEVVAANGLVRKEITIDLSLRQGMERHAEETNGLFTVDQSEPYLLPVNPQNFTFSSSSYANTVTKPSDCADASSHHWETYVIVPMSWIGCANAEERYVIGVFDVWSIETYMSYPVKRNQVCSDREHLGAIA